MIFGRWGFPEMGIRGAAWATVLAGFVGPAILVRDLFWRKTDSEYQTRRAFRFDAKLFARMIRFGLPSAVHLVLDIGAFSLFVLLTGRLGTLGAGVEQHRAGRQQCGIHAVDRHEHRGVDPRGTVPRTRRQPDRGKSRLELPEGGVDLYGGRRTTFIVFPRAYFELFASRGPDGISRWSRSCLLGRILLLMMAAWGMLDTINLVLSGALKGAGDTRFVMYYSVAMAWFLWITGELAILFVLRRGIVAAWLWLMFYVVILAAGFLWRYRGGRWKSIRTPR